MDNSRARYDFFKTGLVISLAFHVIWIFIAVPVIKNPYSIRPASQSIFLGAILKGSDIDPVLQPQISKMKTSLLTNDELRNDAHFKKLPYSIYKPKARSINKIVIAPRASDLSEQRGRKFYPSDISFGLSDYLQYIDRVDFSDLKKRASREELSGFMDFKVLVSGKGEVKAIRKIIGSGDPSFDLYVILKLRNAVFKVYSPRGDVWVKLRFKIKE